MSACQDYYILFVHTIVFVHIQVLLDHLENGTICSQQQELDAREAPGASTIRILFIKNEKCPRDHQCLLKKGPAAETRRQLTRKGEAKERERYSEQEGKLAQDLASGRLPWEGEQKEITSDIGANISSRRSDKDASSQDRQEAPEDQTL